MPKISVIIPAYNAARYICETVDSVLSQTYKNFEVIIIDDGSTDNTQKLLNQYRDKIKYIYQNNKGVAGARNKGIQQAHGKYLAFLDNDDVWLPDKLTKQITISEQNPQVGFIFTDGEFFDEKGLVSLSFCSSRGKQNNGTSLKDKIANTSFNDGSFFQGDFYKDLLMGDLPGGLASTMFVSKMVLNKVGYFDETLDAGEDYDLAVRIAMEYPILYLNSVTTRYRLRDDSISGKVDRRNFFYQEYGAEILKKQLGLCPMHYKSLIKSRILECYKTAIWGYYNFMELKKVRALCLRSLSFDPFQAKLYLYLLATFFPAGFIRPKTRIMAPA
jgi:glycosyltransferase involved in cell wall biosynthesis